MRLEAAAQKRDELETPVTGPVLGGPSNVATFCLEPPGARFELPGAGVGSGMDGPCLIFLSAA